MFCPKCKDEYRDGIEICPECGTSLVENLPKEPPAEDDVPCCVYTAADEFEADVIIAKLRSEGIYAFKKFKGTDDYNRIIFGRTIFGVEILVASGNAEIALEIIKS